MQPVVETRQADGSWGAPQRHSDAWLMNYQTLDIVPPSVEKKNSPRIHAIEENVVMCGRQPVVFDLGQERAAHFKPTPFTQAELDTARDPYDDARWGWVGGSGGISAHVNA